MSGTSRRYGPIVSVDSPALKRAIQEYLPSASERHGWGATGTALTFADFAKGCAIDVSDLYRVMRGNSARIRYDRLDRLAVALNCHVSHFIQTTERGTR